MRKGTFQYHKPAANQMDRIARVRSAFESLEAALRAEAQSNRERSLAFTNIEQAFMWAVKGIVLEHVEEDR